MWCVIRGGARARSVRCLCVCLLTPSPTLSQVFGEVVDGMDIVKLVESKGSNSGSTSGKITIADSGELPL